jgi:hypothetical protein
LASLDLDLTPEDFPDSIIPASGNLFTFVYNSFTVLPNRSPPPRLRASAVRSSEIENQSFNFGLVDTHPVNERSLILKHVPLLQPLGELLVAHTVAGGDFPRVALAHGRALHDAEGPLDPGSFRVLRVRFLMDDGD